MASRKTLALLMVMALASSLMAAGASGVKLGADNTAMVQGKEFSKAYSLLGGIKAYPVRGPGDIDGSLGPSRNLRTGAAEFSLPNIKAMVTVALLVVMLLLEVF